MENDFKQQIQDLITTIALDRRDREHADRELSTKLDTIVDMITQMRSEQAVHVKRLNELPDSVVSMRNLSRMVEANTSSITSMRSIAESAHSKAERNDKILGWFIAGGISSFMGLVVWLIQAGAV